MKRLNWDLHSAIGFWSFAIVFMWAITGAYLVLPKPFDKALSFIPSASLLVNIDIFRALHLGNFGGWPVKVLLVLLGLVPLIPLVTGFIVWWHRVLSPWIRHPSNQRSQAGLWLPRRTYEPEGI